MITLNKFSTRFLSEGTYNFDYAGQYGDQTPAYKLYEESGSEALRVTVSVPGTEVPEGHLLIKSYAENEGLREALLKAGVIENVAVLIPTGFVHAHLCKLTETARQQLGK